MKRYYKFVLAILVLQTASLSHLIAQTQSGNLSQSNLQSIGNQYFVDEAGLQLLQTSSPLDQFIDEGTYFMGPYDVLSIQGNGLFEFSYRAIVVNASGDITAPLIGSISLKGLSFTEAKSAIVEAYNNQLKETEVSVTLDQPRPVSVHVGGNIPNPGRYVLPAGTRYDALVTGFPVDDKVVTPLVNQSIESLLESSAQRPSYSGLNFDKIGAKQQSESEIQNNQLATLRQQYDLRQVKVTPLYGEEFLVDLDGYFNSGNPDFAPFIQDGDQITLITSSSNRATVSISGAVNNPFTGSFRSDDSFDNLLKIAGGYSPDADSSNIVLIRIDGEQIQREELNSNEIEPLQPGDQIIVRFKEIETNFGSVRIEGQVDLPGSFTIQNGETTLSEILDMAGGLSNDALPNAAYLIRNSYDNRGVNSVSSINLSLLGRSSDQFLEGFDYLEFEQALDPNRMALNLTSNEVLEQTKLQNGDQIFIPKDENTITLLGQVNIPGFYSYDNSKTVQNYIDAANGITMAADPERVFIIKAGSRAWYKIEETELSSGDIIFVDRIPFEDISTGRNYAISLQRLKTDRTRLILAGISAATSIVTAYVAIRRLN